MLCLVLFAYSLTCIAYMSDSLTMSMPLSVGLSFWLPFAADATREEGVRLCSFMGSLFCGGFIFIPLFLIAIGSCWFTVWAGHCTCNAQRAHAYASSSVWAPYSLCIPMSTTKKSLTKVMVFIFRFNAFSMWILTGDWIKALNLSELISNAVL